MNRAIVVVLVLAVALAGCTGPDGGGEEPTDNPGTAGVTTTDNDYGAEPNNPPNGTGTEDIAHTPSDNANETTTANGTATADGS